MNALQLVEFTRLLRGLAATLDAPLSEQRIEGYALALSDLDFDVLAASIAHAMKHCKFFPAPAEIREIAEGSADDRGQRAWAQLQQAARSFGAYTSIRLEDHATALAIERTFGSWIACCSVELEPPMVAAKRKEFLANYRIAQRQPLEQARLCLPGLAEAHNRDTASVWGPTRHPIGQMRGLLLADGSIDRETLVLDPDSGRLLEAQDVPQITGEVAPETGLVDVSQALREAAAARTMTAPPAPARGACPSCGATSKDPAHKPECETVSGAAAHEALIRRQARELAVEVRGA